MAFVVPSARPSATGDWCSAARVVGRAPTQTVTAACEAGRPSLGAAGAFVARPRCRARPPPDAHPPPHTPSPPTHTHPPPKGVIFQPELSRVIPYMLLVSLIGIFTLTSLRKLMILEWRVTGARCVGRGAALLNGGASAALRPRASSQGQRRQREGGRGKRKTRQLAVRPPCLLRSRLHARP